MTDLDTTDEAVENLHHRLATACDGVELTTVLTCVSLLWIQAALALGMSKASALEAITSFVDTVYPEEGDDNGYRTVQ